MVVNLFFRILFKVIVILAFVLPLVLAHNGVAQFFSIMLFIIGTVSVFETLRIYKKICLQDNVLVIENIFDGRIFYKFTELESWKENRYYLRGHLRRTLILFFPHKKIIISHYNDKAEYDKVSRHLEQIYKSLEIT